MEKIGEKVKRIETLDWLRGLRTISIMLYHLISWRIEPQNSEPQLEED